MKKICFLAVMGLFVLTGRSQTLITFGKNNVSKTEFLRAYNKNKTPVTDKEKAIRDYVELYTNFKLKVKAAQEIKLDTSEQLQNDLDNFRHQVEENYMSDENTVKAMIEEAFERSQSDLHVIRYSVPMDVYTDPEDTMRQYKALQDVYNKLKSGNNNYTSITQSPDVKFSDLGYITAFSLPYFYENLVYKLKPGETSSMYRSKKAWNVFKVVDKRQSAGRWKVAQILFSFPPDANEENKSNAKKMADSVYALLKGGADFSAVARLYSEDKLTYMSGGELPEFGTGKYDNSFENQVLQLKNDGDISEPFATAFGMHIIKRLSYKPTPSTKTDETFMFDLKQKVSQDERMKVAKDKFAADIITKIGFKVSPLIKQTDIINSADSVFQNLDADLTALPISKKPVITLTKGNIKGEDWLSYFREYRNNGDLYKGETTLQLWEKFKSVAAVDFYRKHLEEYNSEFANQLLEFKEGNMLFEIMEKQVWSKASSDSVGLKAHYEANKTKYTWASSADVLIMNGVSEQLCLETIDSLKAGKSWKDLVNVKLGELQGDSGRYELSQINGIATAAPGSFSAVNKNPDGSASFIKYYRFYEDGQQRSFEDARGMVINDYQSVLEKRWIEELKKQYPVKVNEVLLKEIIKEMK